MLTKIIDELASKLTVESLSVIGKSQLQASICSSLQKLDVVTRAEFTAQTNVLARSKQQLEKLEKTLADLEVQLPNNHLNS